MLKFKQGPGMENDYWKKSTIEEPLLMTIKIEDNHHIFK